MKHIPKGFHTVNPYLIVDGAVSLIQFLKDVFDATEVMRMEEAGKVRHASVTIGDSMVELSDGNDQWKPMPSSLHIYVPDVDGTYAKALQAGAVSLTAPADMFYGERGASIRDAWGNLWHIATLTEDLSVEEMSRRAADLAKESTAK